MALLHLFFKATSKANKAPLLNSEVTSFPSFVTTLLSICSAGILGVLNHPNCSGHTVIAIPSLTNSITF
jgi:hypothetical protein